MAKLAFDTVCYRLPPDKASLECSILINLLNGSAGVVKNNLLDDQPDWLEEVAGEILAPYIESGSGQQEPIQLYRTIIKGIKERLSPSIVYIPWADCDMACVYCWQKERKIGESHSTTQMPSIQAIDATVDYYAASGWKQKPQFHLFGGEPFLPDANHRKKILSVLTHAKSLSLMCHATTSGVHLGEYLDDLHALGFHGFQVTIDGPEEIHNKRRAMSDGKGTFQTICRNVSLALRYGFQVSVRVNIDKYNVDEVPRLLEWCFDAGWTNSNKFSLYFAPVTHHLCHSKTHQSQASELAKLFSYLGEAPGMNRVALRYWKGADLLINLVNHRYLELPRFHYCEAALGGQLVISPGGSLHACLESVGNDQLALGMWEPRFKIDHERSALWQRNVLEIPSCNSCQYRLFCGGGCSFARLSASNNNNEYCEKVDEQVEVALDYLWPHIVNLAIPSKT